jgi:hypothetical protein
MYEDGLISYIPVGVATHMEAPQSGAEALKVRLRAVRETLYPASRIRRSGEEIDPGHLRRVEDAYLQLTPDAPPPSALSHVPRRFVPYAVLRQALGKIALLAPLSDAEAEDSSAAPNRVLLLGQALARNRIMSRDEEKNIYLEVMDTLYKRATASCGKSIRATPKPTSLT